MEIILDYLWDNIGKIASLVAIIGSVYLFIKWLSRFMKKTKTDSQPTFTPEQLKVVTDQAIANAVEENKKASKAPGFESNKPKTIDPAQKKILFDELNKLEQGLTDFKKLLQDM